MEILRTPDERFASLPDWPFAPHYVEVEGIRIHYVDEGPRDGATVLCLHGEPSWSYLYRKMIPTLVGAGLRVVAPDLVGFGRSDKPASQHDYSYELHVDWMAALVGTLELEGVTLFCQDWGGLIGLRLVAGDAERYARICAANTFLPVGEPPMPEAFFAWQKYSQSAPDFRPGRVVAGGCVRPVAPEVVAAYDAPFPEPRFLAGARVFPMLVPTSPDDPESKKNRAAWEHLRRFDRPVLTMFGDGDPITRGADRMIQALMPGCAGQPHRTIEKAGHFLQEDAGEELAGHLAAWIASTPGPGGA